jgi:hypothetical protein
MIYESLNIVELIHVRVHIVASCNLYQNICNFPFWMSHVACHEDATCPYPYNKPTEFQEIL